MYTWAMDWEAEGEKSWKKTKKTAANLELQPLEEAIKITPNWYRV